MAPTARPTAFDIYVCPACKKSLIREKAGLRCTGCSLVYPIDEGIPDFILEGLSQSKDPVLRRMTAIDRMAAIYETRLWYPIVLGFFGGIHSATFAQLVSMASRNIQSVEGRVLDVACGPGTFGRRVASPAKEVYGVDVSLGMLRQGATYTAKEGIANVHFSRARVEALPFENDVFDAAICSGALHLFADTAMALREIARVMKPSAILSVYTFTAGRAGILKYRAVRAWLVKDHGFHVFELPELEQCLNSSGFGDFHADAAGSILAFSARKRPG